MPGNNLSYTTYIIIDWLPIAGTIGGGLFFLVSFLLMKCVGWYWKNKSCISYLKCSDINEYLKEFLVQHWEVFKKRDETGNQLESDDEPRSIVIEAYNQRIPDFYIHSMVCLLLFITCLSMSVFWEAFIFEESRRCEVDPDLACFLTKNRSRADCTNYNSTTDGSVHCYKYAFRFAEGLSAAIAVLGTGLTGYFIVTWLMLCLYKIYRGFSVFCGFLGLFMCLCAGVTPLVIHFLLYELDFESYVYFATFFVITIAAFLLPICLVAYIRSEVPRIRTRSNVPV